MKKNVFPEILGLYHQMDELAAESYSSFSVNAPDEDLRLFWQEMSEEESDHVGFWERLIKLAELDMLPQVFDHPFEMRDKLAAIVEKSSKYLERYRRDPSMANAFFFAYNLEFHMLDAAFLALMDHYHQLLEDDLDIDYQKHIAKFAQAFEKNSGGDPAMELLGESLRRQYQDNNRLIQQVQTDDLTGILNRRGFFRAAQIMAYLAKRNKYPIGLMIVDLDNFKQVNDTHGHLAGDRVLRHAAEWMAADLRQSDLIGRFGGEEFIILLSQVQPAALAEIADGVRRRVEAESKRQIPLTVSIGAVVGEVTGDVGEQLTAMIKRADACMYRAKGQGKNKVVVEQIAG